MSTLIERFREANKGVSEKKLVDMYYHYLTNIEESKRKRDFEKSIMYCQMSLSLLEPLILEWKRESGRFDIKKIPAIEVGAIMHAIKGEAGQLCNIEEVVEYYPELHPWRKQVERAFRMMEVASRIEHYIVLNEGCLQKELKEVLGIEDGRLIADTLYYMDLLGKIRREKAGDTYSLFIL